MVQMKTADLKHSTLQCRGECSTFVLHPIAIKLQYDIFIAVKKFYSTEQNICSLSLSVTSTLVLDLWDKLELALD
jgi:hypothetical protein